MTNAPQLLIGWRLLFVLLEALAPWLVPLDAGAPRSRAATTAQAAIGWLLLAVLFALAMRALERSRWRSSIAWLATVTLATATLSAALSPRGDWPLGASVFVVGPLV